LLKQHIVGQKRPVACSSVQTTGKQRSMVAKLKKWGCIHILPFAPYTPWKTLKKIPWGATLGSRKQWMWVIENISGSPKEKIVEN